MKKIAIWAGAVLAVVLILSLTRDMMIKAFVESQVKAATGLKLNIRSLRIGVISSFVGIDGLRLFNPEGYPDKVMLDMPTIHVYYDLGAIIGGKLHLKAVTINLKELTVVKNEKGELNLNSLKAVQARKKNKPAQDSGKPLQVQIDDLRLKIGKAVYKDYSKGGEPSVKEFNINIDERYENITDLSSLVSLIVVKALMNTSIAGLANFDLGSMKGSVSDTLATAEKVASNAKDVFKGTNAGMKGTTETVKDAVKSLSGMFGNPSGSNDKK